MSLLKIPASNLVAWNLCGNRQNRNTVTVTVEQAIDEVKVSRTATACAYRKVAGKMSVGSGRERGDLFMPDMQPLNLAASADDLGPVAAP